MQNPNRTLLNINAISLKKTTFLHCRSSVNSEQRYSYAVKRLTAAADTVGLLFLKK